jgi:antitoxin component of MazEF toxin-antitoxin module
MIRPLKKIGNSNGILIPKAVLELLKIGEDAVFEIEIRNGGLYLKPLSDKEISTRQELDKLTRNTERSNIS